MDIKKISQEEFATLPNDEMEYASSLYVSQMDEEAFKMLASACSFAQGCNFDEMLEELHEDAELFARNMDNPVFKRVVKRLYEHGVACGHAGSCCNLGNLYHETDGTGSKEDYARAVELYELGVDRGDDQSSINLGYIYYYGRGTAVDYARAYECFAHAALASTNSEAFWKLGDLYASGKGVRKSDAMAWKLYRKAYAFAGDSPLVARAAQHLADYAMKGIKGVVDVDYAQALRLYNEAEIGYYTLIRSGLTYYQRQLNQAIEGQSTARANLQMSGMTLS